MKHHLIIIAALLALTGCITTTDYDPYVTAIDNQLQARSYQTRQPDYAVESAVGIPHRDQASNGTTHETYSYNALHDRQTC